MVQDALIKCQNRLTDLISFGAKEYYNHDNKKPVSNNLYCIGRSILRSGNFSNRFYLNPNIGYDFIFARPDVKTINGVD